MVENTDIIENIYIDSITDILSVSGFTDSFVEQSMYRMGDKPSIINFMNSLNDLKDIPDNILNSNALEKLLDENPSNISEWIKEQLCLGIFNLENDRYIIDDIVMWGTSDPENFLESRYRNELSEVDFKTLDHKRNLLNLNWSDTGNLLLGIKPNEYITEINTFLHYMWLD
jgi:hypothetical protein